MAKILQLPQLVDEHRVSEVQIGRGWVEPGLYPQRTTGLEFINEILLNQQLLAPPLDDLQLFFDFHVQYAAMPLISNRPATGPINPKRNNVIWNASCGL